jgi:hypothetical protein
MICTKQHSWGCFAACIASVLEIPLAELPPYDFSNVGQSDNFFRYLAARNILFRGQTVKDFAPFGYNIICTRTTDGFTHAMVCLNGKPVWCPNGHKLPDKWDGLIDGRDWQPCDPMEWIFFVPLDPSRPMGELLDVTIPDVAEVLENAQALYDSLKPFARYQRPGAVEYETFLHYAGLLADHYCTAETEEQGRADMLSTLDDIQAGRIEKLKEVHTGARAATV